MGYLILLKKKSDIVLEVKLFNSIKPLALFSTKSPIYSIGLIDLIIKKYSFFNYLLFIFFK